MNNKISVILHFKILPMQFLFFFLIATANCLGVREDLGKLFQSQGPNFKIGVEVGVQEGIFSKEILKRWVNCKMFYLVDIWKQMDNYIDGANVNNSEQEEKLRKAAKNVEFAKGKVKIIRKLSSDAAKYFSENNIRFDAVYIDARHDYCGAKEDINAYYPLLNAGGVLSGHDYMPALKGGVNDWNVCANGSYIPGGVKRAVDEFVKSNGLGLNLVSSSWYVFKPAVS
jgi:hypothetical protein